MNNTFCDCNDLFPWYVICTVYVNLNLLNFIVLIFLFDFLSLIPNDKRKIFAQTQEDVEKHGMKDIKQMEI